MVVSAVRPDPLPMKNARTGWSATPILLNPFLLGGCYFVFVVTMYLCGLSELYIIDAEYVFYLIAVSGCLIFLFSLGYRSCRVAIRRASTKYVEWVNVISYGELRRLRRFNAAMFVVGVFGSIVFYRAAGITLFQENKIARPIGEGVFHYVAYLKDLLACQLAVSYLLVRVYHEFHRKLVYVLMMIVSAIFLGVGLNRGVFVFPLIVIIIFECIKAHGSYRFVLFLSAITGLFLGGFSWIGNVRVQYVFDTIYGRSVGEHYGMAGYPTWFVWFYIYLTSPLENFRHMLFSQEPVGHTFGAMLFYPACQVIFKVFGSNLKEYLGLYPYLDNTVGLNMSSFLASAYQDFGALGFVLYLGVYTMLLVWSVRLAAKNVFGIFAYAMALNCLAWMVFTNSLAIGSFGIGWALFVGLAMSDRVVLVGGQAAR